MITKERIKQTAFDKGVNLFGIASVERFKDAPIGFNPKDIYSKAKSVIVFAIKLPTETLFAENPIPYTHVNSLAMQKMDSITFDISLALDNLGLKNVLIPTDDPYLYWDSKNQEGRAILSLRHAAQLAGLGKLGKNNLLINKEYGNMIQIGALITNKELSPDPIAGYKVCPTNCSICIDNCPQNALTGERVIQKDCRTLSSFKTEKGYII